MSSRCCAVLFLFATQACVCPLQVSTTGSTQACWHWSSSSRSISRCFSHWMDPTDRLFSKNKMRRNKLYAHRVISCTLRQLYAAIALVVRCCGLMSWNTHEDCSRISFSCKVLFVMAVPSRVFSNFQVRIQWAVFSQLYAWPQSANIVWPLSIHSNMFGKAKIPTMRRYPRTCHKPELNCFKGLANF